MHELEFRRRLQAALGPPSQPGPALARARLGLQEPPPASSPRLVPWLAGGLALAVVLSMVLGVHQLAPGRARNQHSTAAGTSADRPTAAAAGPACRLALTVVNQGNLVGTGYLNLAERRFEAVPASTYMAAVYPTLPGQTQVIRLDPWRVSPDGRSGAYTLGGRVFIADLASGQSREVWNGPGLIQVVSYQPDAVYFSQQVTGIFPGQGSGTGSVLWAASPITSSSRQVTNENGTFWAAFGGGYAWASLANDGSYADRDQVRRLDLASGRVETLYQGRQPGIDVLGSYGANAVVGVPTGSSAAKGPRTYSQLLLVGTGGQATPLPAPRLADFHRTGVPRGNSEQLWSGATDGVWSISRSAGLSRLADVAGAPPAWVYIDKAC